MKTEGILDKLSEQAHRLPNGCLVWTGENSKGYGRVTFQQRKQFVHRLAWLAEHGAFPKQCVLHRCDNPLCFTIEHLFLGTKRLNNADRDQKGRTAKGEKLPTSKLKEFQIPEMRQRRDEGETLQSLSERFHVCIKTVWDITTRRKWKHV